MLSQNSYFIDILNRTKIFEISVHRLSEPLPMVLFRGTTSVRDSGFFFNIEAFLHNPIGPFRTAEAIIQAAIHHIASNSISCPKYVRQYIDLAPHDIQLNAPCTAIKVKQPSRCMQRCGDACTDGSRPHSSDGPRPPGDGPRPPGHCWPAPGPEASAGKGLCECQL